MAYGTVSLNTTAGPRGRTWGVANSHEARGAVGKKLIGRGNEVSPSQVRYGSAR